MAKNKNIDIFFTPNYMLTLNPLVHSHVWPNFLYGGSKFSL